MNLKESDQIHQGIFLFATYVVGGIIFDHRTTVVASERNVFRYNTRIEYAARRHIRAASSIYKVRTK